MKDMLAKPENSPNHVSLSKLLENTFGIDANTAATIIITVTIFVLGYVIAAINSSFSTYLKRRNYRRIFSDIMNSVVISIGKQADSLSKSATKVHIKNFDDYVVTTVNITHLDNIDKLEFPDVYNGFLTGPENIFNNKKLKAFNKVFSHLSLIKDIESRLHSSMTEFNSILREHAKLWDESVDKLRQVIDATQTATNGTTLPAALVNYLQGVDTIILAWQQLPNRTEYSIVKEEYIDKLLTHNQANQNIAYQGNIILSMNTFLLDAGHHYDNMEKTLVVYSQKLKSTSDLYRSAKRMINKAMSVLSNSYKPVK
jgi:hypothetical protein